MRRTSEVIAARPPSGITSRAARWTITCLTLLVAAAAVRVLTLPLSGTTDLAIFRIWAYDAATLGPSAVYGTATTAPPGPATTAEGIPAAVDYPPIAIDELAAAGRLARAPSLTFPDTAALTIAIKLSVMIASAGLAALIFYSVRGLAGNASGGWAAVAYWANPAVILNGAVLGYIDPFAAFPAVAALVAATRGVGWAAGSLVAIACLTKPQAVLVLPAIALALWRPGTHGARAFGTAITGGLVTSAACIWPLVHAGAFGTMIHAVRRLVTDHLLSANAANVWWIVTFIGQVIHRADGTTLHRALTTPIRVVSMQRFLADIGAGHSMAAIVLLAAFAWAAVLASVLWAMWRARRATDLPRLAAVAAFTVHAYVMLAVEVHENHLFYAVPFLAIVAAARPGYRRVAVAVSLVAALNLYLFYGLGDDVGYRIGRTLMGIDSTVILSVLNVATFVWHAVTLRRECAAEDARDRRPAYE